MLEAINTSMRSLGLRADNRLFLRALALVLLVGIAIPAIFQLVTLCQLWAIQIPFPGDLEWMEGGQIYHGYRIAHGQAIYQAPALGFLPYPYVPLHFVALAIVGKIAGFDYGPARLLSVAFITATGVLLGLEVRSHLANKWEGFSAFTLQLGLLAATVPVVGGFYALARNDSMAIAMPVIAAVLAYRLPKTRPFLALLGLVLTGCVYTKQTDVFFVAWILLFLLIQDKKKGFEVTLWTGGLCAAFFGFFELTSSGNFWLIISETRHHLVNPDRFFLGFQELVKSAPYLPILPMLACFLWGRRSLQRRTLLWTGMFVAALPASLLPFAKAGGWNNNLMPIAILCGPATLLVLADASRCAAEKPLWQTISRYLGYSGLALCIYTLRFDYRAYGPQENLTTQALQLNQWVAQLPGEVLSVSHPMLALLNGKHTEQFHSMPIRDALDAWVGSIGISAFLQRTKPEWLIVNGSDDTRGLQEAIARYYENPNPLPHLIPMSIGAQYPANLIYRRKKEEPQNTRMLFDFEKNYAGWTLTGSAFGSIPTLGNQRCQDTIIGYEGNRLANSHTCHGADAATGTALSPSFVIDRRYLGFLVGGGSNAVRLELQVDGQTVIRASGINQDNLRWMQRDISAWKGKVARIAIVDEDTGGWGHILVDDIQLFD